eukprot:2130387-Pleurochrysis_carterae.AAC.2
MQWSRMNVDQESRSVSRAQERLPDPVAAPRRQHRTEQVRKSRREEAEELRTSEAHTRTHAHTHARTHTHKHTQLFPARHAQFPGSADADAAALTRARNAASASF